MTMNVTQVETDITSLEVDVIVNAANTRLLAGAGVCGRIHDVAGPKLEAECRSIDGCQPGAAVLTRGYNLPAKYVIHTVGPIYGQHNGAEHEILYSCYYESLRIANDKKLTSIAFPEIATGTYGFPKKDARIIAKTALDDFFDDYKDTTLHEILLVQYDKQRT